MKFFSLVTRLLPGAMLFVASFSLAADAVPAQSAHDLVKDVIYNELQDRYRETYWQYHIEKRVGRESFTALQVDTKTGSISRVIARNGQPLNSDQKRQEDERLERLLHSPSEQARARARHDQDEQRLARLLALMPEGFLYEYDGMDEGMQRLKFRPNPAFTPSTFEARIFHALGGTLWVNLQYKRLAHLQGKVISRVDFGYGLLGHMEQGGTFELKRQSVSPVHWKTSFLAVHITGRMILFKTITKDQTEVRSDFKPVPPDTSLEQAHEMLDRPGSSG